MDWLIHWGDEAKKKLKQHAKRWEHEVRNIGDNLDTLFTSICEGTKTEQLKRFPFVHSEPRGILAIDERGPGKGTKMKALRLYVFVSESEQKLYVLTIGDKQSQSRDISQCKAIVSAMNAR